MFKHLNDLYRSARRTMKRKRSGEILPEWQSQVQARIVAIGRVDSVAVPPSVSQCSRSNVCCCSPSKCSSIREPFVLPVPSYLSSLASSTLALDFLSPLPLSSPCESIIIIHTFDNNEKNSTEQKKKYREMISRSDSVCNRVTRIKKEGCVVSPRS